MPQANNPAAFNLYATESPYTARSLRDKIKKRQAELLLQIGDGLVQDWPDYKRRIGVIAGLKEALELLEEIEDEGK